MSVINTIKELLRQAPVYANISCLSPSARLKGRKIIVTGGTGGIGQAMAKRFVEEGADVLITGRNESKLRQISHEIGCKSLTLDVVMVESFADFFSQAIDLLKGFDTLVNSTGISLHESFFDVDAEGFDVQFNTNLRGPFFLTQRALRYFVDNGIKGNVLFISSEAGETADVRPYGLTKAAVNSLAQGLAYAFASDGIRINIIAPGVTATAMTGFNPDEDLFSNTSPVGRVYLPLEVAELAAFLLSDVSSSISGQIITCNNARTVNARWKK